MFRTMDPFAEKYQGISPYTFCAGDPINFSDPTGCDVVILPIEDGEHMAMLIQNEEGNWQYYSYNGTKSYVMTSQSAGRPFNDVAVGNWESPQDFLNSDYNSDSPTGTEDPSQSHFTYDIGYQISSTPEQDTVMREEFQNLSETSYNLVTNNCTQVVQKTLLKGGIDISAETTATYTPVQTEFGIVNVVSDVKIQITNKISVVPSTAFQEIIKANPTGNYVSKSN